MYDNVYNTKRGFTTPVEHIPAESDMLRYASKDETVIPELIEGLMNYIVNSVEWFLEHTLTAQPYYEDCVAEALMSLTEFTNAGLGRSYTPQHFMSSAKLTCLSSVKAWLREMSITVTVPYRSGRRNNIRMVGRKITGAEKITSEETVFSEVWFKAFLGMLDSFDKKLVELKMAGYSDRMIGRDIGLEHHAVSKHLTRLAHLFLEGEV